MKTLKNRLRTASLVIMTCGMVAFFPSCDKDDTDIDEDPIEENLPDITGYPIVGSNQVSSFDNSTIIAKPSSGDDFYGQNSNYPGTEAQYVDNGDGTVTDM